MSVQKKAATGKLQISSKKDGRLNPPDLYQEINNVGLTAEHRLKTFCNDRFRLVALDNRHIQRKSSKENVTKKMRQTDYIHEMDPTML